MIRKLWHSITMEEELAFLLCHYKFSWGEWLNLRDGKFSNADEQEHSLLPGPKAPRSRWEQERNKDRGEQVHGIVVENGLP